jgi:hypothetical protein
MQVKKLKKLTLSKETIRMLEPRDLAYVAGAGDTLSCGNTCECDMKTVPGYCHPYAIQYAISGQERQTRTSPGG